MPHPRFCEHITAESVVVWPHAKGTVRGESIPPSAPSAVDAALQDERLYHVLAPIDAVRIGRPREQKLAMRLLKEILADARLVAEAG